jgi:hypothetical protein
MIGVLTEPSDREIAEEFFELFKTPWEMAVSGRRYRVLLTTKADTDGIEGDLIVAYGAAAGGFGEEKHVNGHSEGRSIEIEWRGTKLPIFGELSTFSVADERGLRLGHRAVSLRQSRNGRVTYRIGYNLFAEVRHLLTAGQPIAHAAIPTLELHIAFLRSVLAGERIPFVEVPARPEACDFICCLTHDIDFFGIRRHRWDRTLAGFLLRATVGSLADLVRRRRTLAEVAQNIAAVLSLPLVQIRIVRDFWRPLDDYARADRGNPSTFFFVPFKARPGIDPDGKVIETRAVRYEMREIAAEITRASRGGCEVAVHGIDAWRDAEAGRTELRELTTIAPAQAVGVRMHWLYFAQHSPQRLDEAGFDYDSTCGYNDAVGYRAGTLQVFRPLGTKRLLELPLAIMDSALLSTRRLGMSNDEALEQCRGVVANARRFGGTVVVNWHDRSLAPERLWNRCYEGLLDEIGDGRAVWFATAREAVGWYRWRRAIRFRVTSDSSVHVEAPPADPSFPRARVALHGVTPCHTWTEELAFDGRSSVTLNLAVEPTPSVVG